MSCTTIIAQISIPLKHIIQDYNAVKIMRIVALGQILINYFHTFNADERTPTEFPLCQKDDHIIKRLHDFMFQLSNSEH